MVESFSSFYGVCLCPGNRGGNIKVTKRRKPMPRASRGQQRSYLTHVAFICNDATIQAKLPQILIANEHTLPASRLAEIRGICPENVFVFREHSAWVNGKMCCRLLKLLKRALKPYVHSHQPILLFDSLKAHFSSHVWRMWRSGGFWPIVVPPKMTWALQPLDTHAFASFKVRLQRLF